MGHRLLASTSANRRGRPPRMCQELRHRRRNQRTAVLTSPTTHLLGAQLADHRVALLISPRPDRRGSCPGRRLTVQMRVPQACHHRHLPGQDRPPRHPARQRRTGSQGRARATRGTVRRRLLSQQQRRTLQPRQSRRQRRTLQPRRSRRQSRLHQRSRSHQLRSRRLWSQSSPRGRAPARRDRRVSPNRRSPRRQTPRSLRRRRSR